jgi:uncharacterized membrane protein (DUF2068 family)
VRHHTRGLLIIAIGKWLNAALLCAVALGFWHLLHHDVNDVADNVTRWLRIDPDNEALGWALNKLSLIDNPKLAALSAVSFGYSALFLVEGTGLYFEKRWAEYLTIIATASLLPVEVYEIIKKLDAAKVFLLAANLAILVFLIITVRKNVKHQRRSN